MIDFTDTTKYPVTGGGTQSSAAFQAASGLTLTHATEAAGVGMTVEGGPNIVWTFPSSGALGTLIQGALARFSTAGCRKEPQRKGMLANNYVGNPGSGPAAGWSTGTSTTDSAVAAPDGSSNATRSIVSSGGNSATQSALSPAGSQQSDDYVFSMWAKSTVNATPFRALLYLAGLYAGQRNPTQSNTWKRERVIGRNSSNFGAGATVAIGAVRGLTEGGFSAEALDCQWFLPQLEYGTQVPSSAIITPSGAAGTRNADLWTIPAASVVSSAGVFAPEFHFIPDGDCPRQLNGTDGDGWLWYLNSSNWGKILPRATYGVGSTTGAALKYGGYVAACVGGNVEILPGWIKYRGGEQVVLKFAPMGNGNPLEAYYTRNGTLYYLGKTITAFGGSSMPNTGTLSLLDNGSTCGFSAVHQGLAFY